ncbi:hypothetical protein EXIGLDRAFT_773633 [Exidia glandulosa HHB12029]|uniref:Uncharacterized protein n=1 Tax=Exidia glandulosa HHB12029 TaxID=1314781 RepID=A0A165EPN2_EXIGL|nr:hypothetical protein EXIGLDRAFT_773633 [Exidia glandulosa HHB12029]
MAYGVHATLYITALTYLWSRRAQDWRWIVYASLVFAVASFGVGNAMQFSEMTYVDAACVEGSKLEGPGAYAALNGGVHPVTISRTAFALGCWLQDGLLLYRVWFIFDRSYIAV